MLSNKNRLSAYHTALVLLINAERFAGDNSKQLSRFRVSKDSLRIASNRKALRETFIAEVVDEMMSLGWSAVDSGSSDTELAFIQTSKISVWPRIGVSRIRKLVTQKTDLESLQEEIEDIFEELFPEPESEEAES